MTPNPTTPVDVAEGRRLLEAVCAAHAHGVQATADCPDPRAIREAADSAWTTWLFENSAALLRAASENVSLREQVVSANEQRDAAVRENTRLRGIIAGSGIDCIYCGLAAADMVKCVSGFPGCGRADDLNDLASAAQGGAK